MDYSTEKKIEKRITSKKELFRAYTGMKDREIRNTINEIIADNRKIDLKIAKNQSKLYPAEVNLFKSQVDHVYKSVG